MKELQKIIRKTVFVFKAGTEKNKFSTDPTETVLTISGATHIIGRKN